MVKLVGHGILKKYSCEIFLKDPIKLQELFVLGSIPEAVWENAIFLKKNSKLNEADLISNTDEVHFYLVPLGG